MKGRPLLNRKFSILIILTADHQVQCLPPPLDTGIDRLLHLKILVADYYYWLAELYWATCYFVIVSLLKFAVIPIEENRHASF